MSAMVRIEMSVSLPGSLGAVHLLHHLVLLELGPVEHVIDDPRLCDCREREYNHEDANLPFLTKSSDNSHLLPNCELFSVKVSFVCESNAGFSIKALTKIHIWFLTWKGLTGAALFFFLICSSLLSVPPYPQSMPRTACWPAK